RFEGANDRRADADDVPLPKLVDSVVQADTARPAYDDVRLFLLAVAVRPRRTNASAVADEGHAEMLGVEVLASEAGLHPLPIGCRVLDLLEVDDREVAHLFSFRDSSR